MAQLTFGTVLREARERKGYDLSSAARRLRIRPDILRSIEESDFARMPPRGYTRNMVNAYARFLGLNPTELTRMYLDEAYAYQVGRVRDDADPDRPSRSGTRTAASSARRQRRSEQEERPPRQNAFGRTLYDDRADYGRSSDQGVSLSQRRGDDRTHPSRHAALQGTQYTNFYAGPKAPGVQSKLPFFIAGGVILIVLIVVLVLVLGGRGGSDTADDTPSVPITGLTDTTQGEDVQEEQVVVATPPSSVQVTYKVASGQEIYAVITTDGTEEAQMISGPAEQDVEVTGTWSFATWVTDAVTVSVDGEALSFDSTDSSGMPMCSVDFATVLDAWYAEHPEVKRPDETSTTTNAGTSSSSTANTTSSTTASTT